MREIDQHEIGCRAGRKPTPEPGRLNHVAGFVADAPATIDGNAASMMAGRLARRVSDTAVTSAIRSGPVQAR